MHPHQSHLEIFGHSILFLCLLPSIFQQYRFLLSRHCLYLLRTRPQFFNAFSLSLCSFFSSCPDCSWPALLLSTPLHSSDIPDSCFITPHQWHSQISAHSTLIFCFLSLTLLLFFNCLFSFLLDLFLTSS